jgi:hypothetical protein
MLYLIVDQAQLAYNGPAIKLVGVAEREKAVASNASLRQSPGTQP